MEKKKIKLSTIILSILLISVALFAGMETFQVIVLKQEIANRTEKSEIIKSDEEEKPYESSYSFDLTNMGAKEKRTYKLNNDYNVTFEMLNNNQNEQVSFCLFVNNNLIIKEDAYFYNKKVEAKVTLWNEYLIYETIGGTDIRSTGMYIIGKDGLVLKEIYELDENNKGMVIDNIYKKSNEIVIEGTRYSHGYAIVSNGNNADSITVNSLKTIPKDTAVRARYTYKLEKGFGNPEVVTLETFEEYVKSNKEKIVFAIKNEADYENEIVDRFINEN